MVGPSFFRMTVFLLRSNVREAIESTRRTEPRNSPRDHTGGETFHRLYDTHCSILENIFLRMNTMVQGRKAPRTFLSEVLLVPYHACSIRSIRPFHTWFCLFLCDPISYSLFSLSLPDSRNSDSGSNSRVFSPFPTTMRCLGYLSHKNFSPFSPRRLASKFANPR